DAGRLRQITMDLLTNAVKFTEAGHIELRAELAGEELRIEVEDTGVGIAHENLERIFEPFWQEQGSLTRQHGGTGLGLAVARRLARQLGGSITAASEPGAGSTFTLRVPVRLAEPDTAES